MRQVDSEACEQSLFLVQVTPVWLLGHLTTLMPPAVDKVFAGLFVANFLFFASQKVTQNIKDDIGDKSVFTCAPPMISFVAFQCCSFRSAMHLMLVRDSGGADF